MTIQNTNVPALRFSEFTEDLKESNLGQIANFTKGKGISKFDVDGNGKFECIRYGELYTHYGETIQNIKSKTNLGENELVFSEYNDVIIPASGETQIDIATASCILKSGVALGGDLNIIKTKLNGVFLSYYLNNRKKKDIASLAQGSSVVHLYANQLKTLQLNLPTLPEQQKIAGFLTTVDEKIQQLAKKKDLLKQYKKSMMQKIFNREIHFKDDNGNDFADWEEKRFGDVITNKSEKYNPEKDKTNYKCIELEHLASETPSLLGFTDSKNSGSIKNKFDKGDVLFGKLRPYLKKYLLAPFDGVCSSEIWVLKGKDILNNYLFQLIQTDDFISLANQSTGSKMPRADWNVISASLLEVPSKSEQNKIAYFLSAIDDKINFVNKQSEKMKEYKKGLLQQMFI